MTGKLDQTAFGMELDRKLDEVIAWAVKECPIVEANLAYADFAKVRIDFHQVATGEVKANNPLSDAEPEDGGPQYINDNPAPWP